MIPSTSPRMISSTFRANVYGNSYDELLENAKEKIAALLDLEDLEEAFSRARCEMIISSEPDVSSDFNYTAEMIARIK